MFLFINQKLQRHFCHFGGLRRGRRYYISRRLRLRNKEKEKNKPHSNKSDDRWLGVLLTGLYAQLHLVILSIYLSTVFNKFPDFFVQAYKIIVDSWKFTRLLLYILWDDWPIFMISGSNEQLQQELEYTLLKCLIVTAGEFQKCNLDVKTF